MELTKEQMRKYVTVVCVYQAIRWASWHLVPVPQQLVFYNSPALNVFSVEIMLGTRLSISKLFCSWQIFILHGSPIPTEKADVLICLGVEVFGVVITEKLQRGGIAG